MLCTYFRHPSHAKVYHMTGFAVAGEAFGMAVTFLRLQSGATVCQCQNGIGHAAMTFSVREHLYSIDYRHSPCTYLSQACA